MKASETIKVFVSYSWDVEKKTEIAAKLKGLCQQRGINLIPDSSTLKHGESIKKFMDELSRGDHVITLFSNPYFESTWCMYELLRIYQRGDFEQRTHPVIADDCDLQDSDYRLKVVDFWENTFKTEEGKLKGHDPLTIIPELQRVEIYRDIYQNINELVNFAADRLITPLAELQQKDYRELLDRIKLAQTQADLSNSLSDEDFLLEIRQSIAIDMKKSDSLREHIIQNCDRDFGDGQKLHDYLIEQCINGQFVEVIQNIESAFVDSYDSIDEKDIRALNKLINAAEDTVSKLVLFNIKNEWMMQFRNECGTKSYHEHFLPEMSIGSVQVVSSREARSLPKFNMNRNSLNIEGSNGVALEPGIHSTDVVREVIKRLYFRVKNQELTKDFDEKLAVSTLQKIIKYRKQQKNLKLRKNYFLLMPTENQHSGLEDSEVQEKLKELLPDLSLIRINSGSDEDIFIVEDEDLMVAISEFFTTLETYKFK